MCDDLYASLGSENKMLSRDWGSPEMSEPWTSLEASSTSKTRCFQEIGAVLRCPSLGQAWKRVALQKQDACKRLGQSWDVWALDKLGSLGQALFLQYPSNFSAMFSKNCLKHLSNIPAISLQYPCNISAITVRLQYLCTSSAISLHI